MMFIVKRTFFRLGFDNWNTDSEYNPRSGLLAALAREVFYRIA